MYISESTKQTLKSPTITHAVVGVSSLIIGAGIGYIFGKKQKNTAVSEPVKNETQASLFDYLQEQELPMNDAGQIVVNVVEKQPADGTKIDYAALSKPIETTPEPSPVVNVFLNENEDWDYDAELSTRNGEVPYIISQDEFVADEMGFKQDTVTYYVGDDIMADPMDTPIYNYSALMGDLRFGHGSKDPNVVYIRNEKMHIEWEVLRHTGHFSVEVMGLIREQELEDEIRHSSVRKFREF
jgi:hypothetical protein